MIFQVIDDLLDFTESSDTLGKPGLQASPHARTPDCRPRRRRRHPCPPRSVSSVASVAFPTAVASSSAPQDMALGLSTAPVLYGIEDEPELRELVERKFGALLTPPRPPPPSHNQVPTTLLAPATATAVRPTASLALF